MASLLAYAAGVLVGLWGVAHAAPTRQVLAGFNLTSRDDRLVVLQEWLAEAVTMWGVSVLVIVVTAVGSGSAVTGWVYRLCAGVLLVLAVLTGFTGARTPVVWFKICPVLLTVSAVLLVVASVV